MRFLLAHNSTYYPAQGGGDKSNRLLMEALAERGHTVSVVARTAAHGPEAHRELLSDLAQRDISAYIGEHGVVRFRLNRVDVHTCTESPNLRAYFARQIEAFQPDVIVCSTDDTAQILLRAALDSPAFVVYFGRATVALPFGPDCAFPSEEKTNAIREADGVVGVSQYVADYIREHSGIPAVHFPISLMDGGPWPQRGRYTNEFVTLINPCLVKGIDLFLDIAKALPDTQFAGVRSWGTTDEDLAKLHRLPNVTVLEPVDNIDVVFERTRVLLVPSIWAEARARVVQEAMLRGIPVIASDTGGLGEAKLGVPYILPVNQIGRFHGSLDQQMVPKGETPTQNMKPWIEATEKLTHDEAHWNEIAVASRNAALDYSKHLTAEPFEDYLRERMPARRSRPTKGSVIPALTLEQKKMLALKIRNRRAADWLVPMDGDPGPVKLICFPYAATGPNVYRKWSGVTAVQYPGREGRLNEAPISTPQAMLDAMMEHLAPKLSGRFAFFGHSMGAGLAFEFARRLQEAGGPMPEQLFVSGARAPHLRTVVSPDPSDESLLASLTRMNPGRAPKVLEAILPLFRADTALYRRYVYEPGELLRIPIHAYGGEQDSGVASEYLELWRKETTGAFSLRMFPGGHLYLENLGQDLLEDIRAHLAG